MPKDRKRRLAAIMFTDIAGYTKLMEESESRAQALRQRHRAVFEQAHVQYRGEIIQYFGDGTLSVFDSCVEAVKCAVSMQQAFQQEPQVPLRIGIHLGDIEHSAVDIVGSGVNVASRVESLGIPGSILISDEVRKQVMNHEVLTVSMGEFEMKNMRESLEIFAVDAEGIIIPDREELVGKGKRVEKNQKPNRQIQSWIRLSSIGFVAMAVGAILFWALGSKELGETQLLPESIREEKVAVSVFENFTGDEELDALGYLASEWISSGLRELKIRTVSPEMVRQNKDLIGILPGNPNNEGSFYGITGAKYVINGSYFLQNDSIVLSTRLSSTESGEELHTFPAIKGHKAKHEQLIEEARQYMLGYWVLKRDQQLPTTTPPRYDAYKAYLKCFINDIECQKAVVKIDPDFLLARVYLMYAGALFERDSLYQTNKAYVSQRWDLCTAFEKNVFHYASYLWLGNYQEAFNSLEANYELDSKDHLMLHESAYFAFAALNRPKFAADRFELLFENNQVFERRNTSASILHYMAALNHQKAYTKLLDFYNGLKNKSEELIEPMVASEIMIALMNLKQMDEVNTFLKQRKNSPFEFEYHIRAAYTFNYLFPDSSENPFLEGVKDRLEQFDDPPHKRLHWQTLWVFDNWSSKSTAYFVLKEWEKAEELLLNLQNYSWDDYHQKYQIPVAARHREKLWISSMLGCVYAKQGKTEESMKQIQLLEQLERQYSIDPHAPLFRGPIPYLQARIYATLGEKKKATELLRIAIDQGKLFTWLGIRFDLHLVNLKGYEPFEELIRPKG